MDLREVSEDIWISSMIKVEDLELLYQEGYRSIICNLPNGEIPGQSEYSEIEAKALELGMEPYYIPVTNRGITESMIDDAAVFLEMHIKKGKVVAYCRSGGRSNTILEMTGML